MSYENVNTGRFFQKAFVLRTAVTVLPNLLKTRPDGIFIPSGNISPIRQMQPPLILDNCTEYERLRFSGNKKFNYPPFGKCRA